MHRLYFIWERKFYARKHYATLENNPKGGFPLLRNFYVRTHVNFTRVNEMKRKRKR